MTPPKHNPRIDRATFDRIAPAAAAALGTLGRVVGDSGHDKSLVELIKLRASDQRLRILYPVPPERGAPDRGAFGQARLGGGMA